ncbi:MAG: 50S ribosomal protein L6 [Candidatus Nealsonbacteria bacterium]|nr:MAG: 50S ribosomal protein L6 [Candidatus Nealsonbacteria bacterium]
MSRIGKKPIEIPEGVEVKIDYKRVTIKGPRGELSREVRPEIKVELKEGKIFVLPKSKTKNTKAFWGLTRALLNNMVKGVTEGYEKKLEIRGLGYKANVEGDNLVLMVGFTHSVKIKIPKEIKISVEKNIITISGIDKELVGLIAAKTRKVKPPEPYKGKGIRYVGEEVRRKAGKKVVTGGVAG